MRTFVHKLCLGLLLISPLAAFSQDSAKDDMKQAGEDTTPTRRHRHVTTKRIMAA